MSTRICVFGASIAWGAWDPDGGGWVTRLRRYFEINDYDIEVYNLGVSGNTTKDLLKRFKTNVSQENPKS